MKAAKDDSEKGWFYEWLKSNYMEHLRKHEKNKRAYFENAKRRNLFASVVCGANKIWMTIAAIVTGGFGGTFLSTKTIENLKKNGILDSIPKSVLIVGCGIAGAVILCTVLLLAFVVIRNGYEERKSDLQQNRETWLRHARAIQEYQSEMLGYIFEVGEYENITEEIQRDQVLMTRVKAVWSKNYEKFEQNMVGKNEKDEKVN